MVEDLECEGKFIPEDWAVEVESCEAVKINLRADEQKAEAGLPKTLGSMEEGYETTEKRPACLPESVNVHL